MPEIKLEINCEILLEILFIIIWIENRKVFTCDSNYLASHPNWLRSISCFKSYTAVCYLFILYYLSEIWMPLNLALLHCVDDEKQLGLDVSAQRNIQRLLSSWEWCIDGRVTIAFRMNENPDQETHHDCLPVPL